MSCPFIFEQHPVSPLKSFTYLNFSACYRVNLTEDPYSAMGCNSADGTCIKLCVRATKSRKEDSILDI